MIICEPDRVEFPKDRKSQADDLMALAGDALMRGDAVAWRLLHRASRVLGGAPEYDSPEGRHESAAIQADISRALRGDEK